MLSDTGSRSNRGTRGAAATLPDTRQTNTSATVHDQSRTQPVQSVPVAHGPQTKQNPHINQQNQSVPTTTTAQGALYHQDIDHPTVPV